jgi:hypothetical protein
VSQKNYLKIKGLIKEENDKFTKIDFKKKSVNRFAMKIFNINHLISMC